MHCKCLAAALLTALPALAAAQSGVTIYGIADAAIASEDLDAPGTDRNTVINSGNQSSSRIGFRGTEDLGYGLKALFNVEAGVAIDTGASDSAGLFQRRAVVGVQHAIGTLTLGREYSPISSIAGATDILGQGFYGSNLSAFGTNPLVPRLTRRWSNSVNFKSSGWRNFTLLAAYSASPTGSEPVGEFEPSRTTKGIAVEWASGQFYVGAGFHSLKRLPEDDDKEYAVGLGFNFGQFEFKANGLRADQEGAGRFDQYNLGVSMTTGAHKFFVNAQRNEVDDRQGDAFAIAYTYNWSKRTNLYASFAKVFNDDGAVFGLTSAGTSLNPPIATGSGSDPRAFSLGVRHTF